MTNRDWRRVRRAMRRQERRYRKSLFANDRAPLPVLGWVALAACACVVAFAYGYDRGAADMHELHAEARTESTDER